MCKRSSVCRVVSRVLDRTQFPSLAMVGACELINAEWEMELTEVRL
jgi:hypothetical protein